MGTGRLSRALPISLSASVSGALLAFVLAAVVSRQLGASGAGVYLQCVALFTIVATSLKLGADTGLVRAMSQALALHRSEDIRPTLRVALVPVMLVATSVAVALGLGASAAASLLTDGQREAQELTGLFHFLAPFLVFSAGLTVSLGALRGLGSVLGFSLILNVGLPLGRLLLVIVALASGLGAVGAVQGWALGLPLWAIAAAVMLRRSVQRHAPVDQGARPLTPRDRGSEPIDQGPSPDGKPLWRGFWGFSVGRWAAATVEILLDWIDVLLVGALTDVATAGLYGVATRVVRAGQVVDNAMRVAVGPRISELLALGDRAGVDTLLRRATRAMVALTLPFYVTCMIFAGPILALFGPEFSAAAPALRILAAGMAVSAATVLLQSVVLMGGRSHWQLMNKLAALGVAVLANIALIPVLGIAGAALAWVLAVLTDLVLVTVQTHRLVGVRPRPAELLPVALVVGGAVALIGAVCATLVDNPRTGLIVHLGILGVVAVIAGAISVATGRVPGVSVHGRSRAVGEAPEALSGSPPRAGVPRP